MATPDEIRQRINGVDAVLKSINGSISGLLNNLLLKLVPGARDVLNFLHDRVADISHILEDVVRSITGTIGGAIGAIVPTAIDFLIGIANDVFNDVHNILGNLATAEEFVAGAIGEISRHAGKASEFLLGAIGGGIAGGLVDVLKFLEGQDKATVDHFLDQILKAKSLPDWLRHMVGGLRGRGAEWQALALPLLVGVLLQPIGEAMVNPLLVELKQESNALFRTEVLPISELVTARIKNVIQDGAFYEGMARNNINQERAHQMLMAHIDRLLPEEAARLVFRGTIQQEAARLELGERAITRDRVDMKIESLRPLLSEDEIRQTYLRGIIDESKHDALMAQHGYHFDAIARKKSLYFLIPGPQDLIHMAIRNVFSPEIVERFQLFGDFPPAFQQAAHQQGISNEWALRYWGAHWIVPSNTEGFEMFHRTTEKSTDEHADSFTLSDGTRVQNVIGRSTLQLLLREKDVAPYYRNKLTEIAYSPLTRIDVRRMYSVGALSHAGVERAYLDLGYSPKNARRLADFVKLYYDAAKKDKAQPLIDGLRRKILDLYVQEKLDWGDAGFAIIDLGFTELEANSYLAEAKLVQQAEDARQIETGIGRIYMARYIDEDEARKRLTEAKVPSAAIDRLIRKWNLDIEYKQDTEHFHKARDLTKSEVLEAYKDKLMDKPTVEAFLEMLGYPAIEADVLIALTDYRAERDTRKATTDAIKQLYTNGIRDYQQTSNSLDSLYLPVAQRDALLAEWTLLRETRTEKIPIATLRDMVRNQFLSVDDAFSHLKRHRYTDNDATMLIAFWQGTKPKGGGILGAITGG